MIRLLLVVLMAFHSRYAISSNEEIRNRPAVIALDEDQFLIVGGTDNKNEPVHVPKVYSLKAGQFSERHTYKLECGKYFAKKLSNENILFFPLCDGRHHILRYDFTKDIWYKGPKQQGRLRSLVKTLDANQFLLVAHRYGSVHWKTQSYCSGHSILGCVIDMFNPKIYWNDLFGGERAQVCLFDTAKLDWNQCNESDVFEALEVCEGSICQITKGTNFIDRAKSPIALEVTGNKFNWKSLKDTNVSSSEVVYDEINQFEDGLTIGSNGHRYGSFFDSVRESFTIYKPKAKYGDGFFAYLPGKLGLKDVTPIFAKESILLLFGGSVRNATLPNSNPELITVDPKKRVGHQGVVVLDFDKFAGRHSTRPEVPDEQVIQRMFAKPSTESMSDMTQPFFYSNCGNSSQLKGMSEVHTSLQNIGWRIYGNIEHRKAGTKDESFHGMYRRGNEVLSAIFTLSNGSPAAIYMLCDISR